VQYPLRKVCISPNPSLRAQRSNPFSLANQALTDRRIASLLAMTAFCRPSLGVKPPPAAAAFNARQILARLNIDEAVYL